MAEIINLRAVRKAKARSGKQNRASANRALYGRTPAEKARDEAAAERHGRQLDQAKREVDEQ